MIFGSIIIWYLPFKLQFIILVRNIYAFWSYSFDNKNLEPQSDGKLWNYKSSKVIKVRFNTAVFALVLLAAHMYGMRSFTVFSLVLDDLGSRK